MKLNMSICLVWLTIAHAFAGAGGSAPLATEERHVPAEGGNRVSSGRESDDLERVIREKLDAMRNSTREQITQTHMDCVAAIADRWTRELEGDPIRPRQATSNTEPARVQPLDVVITDREYVIVSELLNGDMSEFFDIKPILNGIRGLPDDAMPYFRSVVNSCVGAPLVVGEYQKKVVVATVGSLSFSKKDLEVLSDVLPHLFRDQVLWNDSLSSLERERILKILATVPVDSRQMVWRRLVIQKDTSPLYSLTENAIKSELETLLRNKRQ